MRRRAGKGVDAGVARVAAVAAVLIALLQAVLPARVEARQASRADLALARTAFNERRYDDAVAAAMTARKASEIADAAGIVLALSYLELYRQRSDPADLSAARDVLGSLRVAGLDDRDRVEWILAAGEALYLQDDFGAAAEMFESGLGRAVALSSELAEAILEWWGSAVDAQASALPPEPRKALFARQAERMRVELARAPHSAAASYWYVAALRGAGEAERAWHGAVAAYVRARLVGEPSERLRADLNVLVLTGVIPDRVRPVAQDERRAAEAQLRVEWELLKERWK